MAVIKIIFSAVLAIGLFVTGIYYLSVIKNNAAHISAPSLVIDFEPSCNEEGYLDVGNSLDDTVVNSTENKPYPDGEFIAIEDGQTLHSIFRSKKVSEHEIARLGLALKPYLLARDLAPGDNYWFDLIEAESANLVDTFVIKKLDSNRVPILYTIKRTTQEVNEPDFSVEIKHPEVKEEAAFITLEVKGTLYQTFNQIPFGPELMQRLMNVFAWQLRMPEEVSQGDQIELLVKKKYVHDEFIGYGAINSIYYRQKTRTFFAAFFVSKDQKITGFFDEQGKSLEKEFAYSPVHESTATSDQKWRFHPVRKMRIRHNGIDYRGTIGTDFFSIADGEVVEKRFDKNVGNMVRVKHKYGVYSEYFHADTLNDKMSVGSMVKRGQKLGTIGRTGKLCTGPHLHMGLYRLQNEKRKFIELSSLRKTLKPAPSISQPYMAEFKQHVTSLIALMEQHQKTILAGSH
jgi:murein DD-endopeptidase MepM/ murein hydrolase activator NlpD